MSPTLATVWGLFQQNISINQLLGNSEVLTWAAAWRGSDQIMDGDLLRDGKRKMLVKIHGLLDEADAVVTWNGDGFDLKILAKEFMLLGLPPPKPFKSIDLLQTSRKKFRFTSNKLDFVAKQLGVPCKIQHRGHEMWLDCMARKPAAFKEMRHYNRGDIPPLQGIYERFLPWIPGHPHPALYDGGKACCPRCGNDDPKKFQARGYARTSTLVYKRLQCKKCGGWARTRTADKGHSRPELVAA